MIYAPTLYHFSSPFLPPLKRGYGHARAKNILAKCDSRVSLSSSTDVVEAIKSEPEAASRGLKRLLYPYCLSTPIHFFIRRKKKKKIYYSPKRYVWRIEEAAILFHDHSFLSSSPSFLIWFFWGSVPGERNKRKYITSFPSSSLPPCSFHFDHFLRANHPHY